MKFARARTAAAFLTLALAAGCTSQDQIAKHSLVPPHPEPYRAALQAEFLLLADREAARNDHLDAKRFLQRSVETLRAVSIWPHDLDAYDVEPAERAELEAARARLITLFDGGRARAPAALARAHAAFECWLEEAEEGHQPEDIAWCRDRFEGAVRETRLESGLDADWGVVVEGDDGHVGAVSLSGVGGGDAHVLDGHRAASFVHEEAGDARKAAMTDGEHGRMSGGALAFMPPAPALFTVYFASGSDRLSEAALAVIADAAADAERRMAVDVEILGFADRAGEDRRNLDLSERRAEAVRAALAEAGVPEDAFLIYARGEDAPAISTPDGVAEARNRRVEITVR